MGVELRVQLKFLQGAKGGRLREMEPMWGEEWSLIRPSSAPTVSAGKTPSGCLKPQMAPNLYILHIFLYTVR